MSEQELNQTVTRHIGEQPPACVTAALGALSPQTPNALGNMMESPQLLVRAISHSSNFTVGNIVHWHVDVKSNTSDKSEAYLNYCSKDDDLFVETSAYLEVKKTLMANNVVNIVGGSGDGKTALLKHLALDMSSNEMYSPLEITKPEDIDTNYTEDKKFLFICDDPFGGPYLQQDLVNAWVRAAESIEKYLETGTFKIAFASRKTIWADCHRCLGDFRIFKQLVEVTSARLTPEEKEQVLLKHLGHKRGLLTPSLISSIIELESPIAFPYCCKFASSSKDLTPRKLLYSFKRPFVHLRKELRKMLENTHWKYAALVLVMLYRGALPCDQLNLSEANCSTKSLVETVLDACGIADAQRPFGQLRLCADSLLDSYLIRGQNGIKESVYCFAHDAVFEAVAIDYGEDHVADFLKYSDKEWIVTICRPHNYDVNETEAAIRVSKRHYPKLAEKFTKQILLGTSKVPHVFASPCVQDTDFQIAWIEYIKTTSKTEDFKRLEDPGGRCILYCAASVGALEMVKFLLAEGCCSSGNPYYHPLVGAARGGHLDELILLLDTNPPDDVVQIAVEDACFQGCWETVNHLFSTKTKQCSEVVGQALISASLNGHPPLVSFLLNHNPSEADIESAFVEACKRGHYSIIQHLLCLKKEICCRKVDQGFVGAAGAGKTKVLNILLKEKPSVDALGDALYVATQWKHADVLPLIFSENTKVDVSRSLVCAARTGNLKFVHYLLQICESEQGIQAAFVQACRFDRINIAELLWQSNEDVCRRSLEEATEKSAQGNAMEAMRFLIQLNPPQKAFEKALIAASRYGTTKMVKHLFSLGSVHFSKSVLEAAFFEACRKGQCETVNFLLDKGVDVNCTNEAGKCAIQLASERWRTSVVNILVKAGASQDDTNQ